MSKIIGFIKWLVGNRLRAAVIIILFLTGVFFIVRAQTNKSTQVQFQTAQAETGTLVTSVSASGQITTANNVQITIQSSGAIKEVLVKNGDQVLQGQTIAILTLDQASQQKQAQAYASYLQAKANLDTANAKINSLQSAEFKANQKLINDAVERDLAADDPTYIQENADWLQSEADYKNQQGQIAQAQAALGSAALTLSQTSSTITAPVAGEVKGLTITPGAIVTLSSSSSNSTSTSQVLGSIYQTGPTQAQVNLSEVDSVKVTEGQRATMTLDAFPDEQSSTGYKTFTGEVLSINTNGVVSSGVTTYPAVISFDSSTDHIYPNMAVSAKIITNVKNDVVLVPSAAVATSNGQSSVRVLQNGNPVSVNVEVGDSNDTQTEITSGVSEGETVITGITGGSRSSTGTTSPFGGGFGRGVGGFGGGVRVGR